LQKKEGQKNIMEQHTEHKRVTSQNSQHEQNWWCRQSDAVAINKFAIAGAKKMGAFGVKKRQVT
jgi:hypothetical protein